MTFLFIVFSALLSLTPPVWLKDLEQAKNQARQENKVILINFSGSDWCGPCIKLTKEVFQSEPFAEFAADNLVLVNADFPRMKKNLPDAAQVAKNEKLADQYNPTGILPLTLLLDAEGKVLYKWEGYPGKNAAEVMRMLQEAKK